MIIVKSILSLLLFIIVFNFFVWLICTLMAFIMDNSFKKDKDTEKFINKYSPYQKNKFFGGKNESETKNNKIHK